MCNHPLFYQCVHWCHVSISVVLSVFCLSRNHNPDIIVVNILNWVRLLLPTVYSKCSNGRKKCNKMNCIATESFIWRNNNNRIKFCWLEKRRSSITDSVARRQERERERDINDDEEESNKQGKPRGRTTTTTTKQGAKNHEPRWG